MAAGGGWAAEPDPGMTAAEPLPVLKRIALRLEESKRMRLPKD